MRLSVASWGYLGCLRATWAFLEDSLERLGLRLGRPVRRPNDEHLRLSFCDSRRVHEVPSCRLGARVLQVLATRASPFPERCFMKCGVDAPKIGWPPLGWTRPLRVCCRQRQKFVLWPILTNHVSRTRATLVMKAHPLDVTCCASVSAVSEQTNVTLRTCAALGDQAITRVCRGRHQCLTSRFVDARALRLLAIRGRCPRLCFSKCRAIAPRQRCRRRHIVLPPHHADTRRMCCSDVSYHADLRYRSLRVLATRVGIFPELCCMKCPDDEPD